MICIGLFQIFEELFFFYYQCSAYDYDVSPFGKELVKTDLSMAIPDGHYGRIGKSL